MAGFEESKRSAFDNAKWADAEEVKKQQEASARTFQMNVLMGVLVCAVLIGVAVWALGGVEWFQNATRPQIKVSQVAEQYGANGYTITFIAENTFKTAKRVQFEAGMDPAGKSGAGQIRTKKTLVLDAGQARQVEAAVSAPSREVGSGFIADSTEDKEIYVKVLSVEDADGAAGNY